MCWAEWLTFKAAQVTIATNESYYKVALTRGGKMPEDVFIVRSGPNLKRLREMPPNPSWKKGRAHLVAYVGVMDNRKVLISCSKQRST